MSTGLRRSTRSASRAQSETSEPAESASSVQSSRPESRRTRKSGKPTESIPKETYSYGTDTPGTRSQQRAAQAAMKKPVRSIETRVEEAAQDAAEGYATGLSAISEEAQTGGDVFGRYEVGSDHGGTLGNLSDSELIGTKTFGRENEDTLNLQNQRQSRAPSIEREQSRAPSIERDQWYYPRRVSTWDKIDAWVLRIFRAVGCLLPIFYLAAAVISLCFIARWYPVIENPQGSIYNCSSLGTTECPPRAPPLATAQIERLGRRVDDLEGKFRAQPITRRINWLSWDMGARSIPDLSSPNDYFEKGKAKVTMPAQVYKQPGYGTSTYEFFLGDLEVPVPDPLAQFQLVDYGPDSALQPYRENEARYCTPGKLQLAVKLPRLVAPLHLIIEYYLKDEVLSVGAAPKEVELWIPIGDHTARAAVVSQVARFYPDILPDELSEPARFHEHKIALDFTWVPIGRWTYDIHANEAQQKFRVIPDLDSYDIAVDEIVIRVNSNWANKELTCLVRARLDGLDRSGYHEQLDPR